MDSLQISVAWAISQYREIAGVINRRIRGRQTVRTPNDPPEVTAYFRNVGIGRHVDVYA
jgi:hypothetical protein